MRSLLFVLIYALSLLSFESSFARPSTNEVEDLLIYAPDPTHLANGNAIDSEITRLMSLMKIKFAIAHDLNDFAALTAAGRRFKAFLDINYNHTNIQWHTHNDDAPAPGILTNFSGGQIRGSYSYLRITPDDNYDIKHGNLAVIPNGLDPIAERFFQALSPLLTEQPILVFSTGNMMQAEYTQKEPEAYFRLPKVVTMKMNLSAHFDPIRKALGRDKIVLVGGCDKGCRPTDKVFFKNNLSRMFHVLFRSSSEYTALVIEDYSPGATIAAEYGWEVNTGSVAEFALQSQVLCERKLSAK